MPAQPATPLLAKWREVSGLTVEAEKSLQGHARRAAIRKLLVATEAEIRAELRLASEDADFNAERTFLWEPIPAVCRQLDISQSALNRLLKELTGMTASQLADKIRAENLREKLRAHLIVHVQKYHEKPGATYGRTGEHLLKFWDELKDRRSNPSFSFATRAIELGFANYTRLYRACLLHYGKTPTQLEREILKEIAEFFACASELLLRRDANHYIHRDSESYQRHREPYSDNWAQATQSRQEWLAKNKECFGLADAALPWL